MSDNWFLECEKLLEEKTSEDMDPMSQKRSISSFKNTTSDLEPDEHKYDLSDGSSIGRGLPSIEDNPEAMNENSNSSANSILKYFGSDSSFWSALTQPLNHHLVSPSYADVEQISQDRSIHSCYTISSDSEPYNGLPAARKAPAEEESTPEAIDENSISSNISDDSEPFSSFWRTQPLGQLSPSYLVVELISHESSNHSCQTISSDSEPYELEVSNGLPVDRRTPSDKLTPKAMEENSISSPQNMSSDFDPNSSFWSASTQPLDHHLVSPSYVEERSILSCYTISSDSELDYEVSNGSPVHRGTPSEEESTSEAMEANSTSSPQNISSDFETDSLFWSALTPPLLVPVENSICPNSEPRVNPLNDYTIQRSLSMMDLMLPRDTIKPSYNKKPRTLKDKGLTMLTTTFKIVTENLNSWIKKKRFHESKNVYFFSLPKRLLSDTIIHQVLRFKAHDTVYNFRMQQKLICRNRVIDQWFFEKGFVRSKVITVWETIMKRSPGSDFFIDPTITSRVVLETKLYDGERLLHEYWMHIVLT